MGNTQTVQTQLWAAISQGDVRTIREHAGKVDLGALRDPTGRTALMFAVERGDAAVVEALLQAGVSPHLTTPRSQETALHVAARLNRVDSALMLLRFNADPFAQSTLHKTPQEVARESGSGEVLELIESRIAQFRGWVSELQDMVIVDLAKRRYLVVVPRRRPNTRYSEYVRCGVCAAVVSCTTGRPDVPYGPLRVPCSRCSTVLGAEPPFVLLPDLQVYSSPQQRGPPQHINVAAHVVSHCEEGRPAVTVDGYVLGPLDIAVKPSGLQAVVTSASALRLRLPDRESLRALLVALNVVPAPAGHDAARAADALATAAPPPSFSLSAPAGFVGQLQPAALRRPSASAPAPPSAPGASATAPDLPSAPRHALPLPLPPQQQQQQPTDAYRAAAGGHTGGKMGSDAYHVAPPPVPSAPAAPSAPLVPSAPAASSGVEASTAVAAAARGSASTPVVDTQSECVVCMDRPRDSVCIPCGHICACKGCLDGILQSGGGCPVCRAALAQVVRVYNA